MGFYHFYVAPFSGFVGDLPVILAKPQTYMNLSGESVKICFSYSYYHTFKKLVYTMTSGHVRGLMRSFLIFDIVIIVLKRCIVIIKSVVFVIYCVSS